jgi:uncharacterized OB-fold protein
MMSNLKKGVYPVPMTDPHADEAVQPFWDNTLKGKLCVSQCTNCRTMLLPPQPFCFVCQHHEFKWVELPGTGTIYTFTVVRHPLRRDLAEVVPYVAGIVELDGTQGAGARIQANIINCDPEQVRIGDKVRVVFDKVSDTFAVTRFEPLRS